MDKYRHIPKKPIQLDRNTICMLQLFKRVDGIDDLMFSDEPDYMIHQFGIHKAAAQEFVRQLDDQWCVLFMEELVKAVLAEVQEGERRELYKNMLEHIMDSHTIEVARITKRREEEKNKEIDDTIVPPAKLINK